MLSDKSLKPVKLTLRQHQSLRRGGDNPSGVIDCGDNGVLNSLVKRGLACRDINGKTYITDTGSAAIHNARIDPKSQPTGMPDDGFHQYVKLWSK